MPKNIYVILQMMRSYLKHQEKGNICYFFTTKNKNLDSEITKVENLKTKKFSQFLGNSIRRLSAHFFKDKTPTTQKMKFSIRDFFSKCEEILHRKLHFLCSDHYLRTKIILKAGLGLHSKWDGI